MRTEARPLLRPALLLGMGLGGFLDGIVFHQVLQLHQMLSAVRPKTSLVDVEVNMFWDGLFHLGTWAATFAGLVLLWRALLRGAPLATRVLAGGMLAGWGAFNAVEGLVDHHVLGIHHVVEAWGLSMADHAFVASGFVLALGGWLLIRSDSVRRG